MDRYKSPYNYKDSRNRSGVSQSTDFASSLFRDYNNQNNRNNATNNLDFHPHGYRNSPNVNTASNPLYNINQYSPIKDESSQILLMQDGIRSLADKRQQERNYLLDMINRNGSSNPQSLRNSPERKIGIFNPYLGSSNIPVMGINPNSEKNLQTEKIRKSKNFIQTDSRKKSDSTIQLDSIHNESKVDEFSAKALQELNENISELKEEISAKVRQLKRKQEKFKFDDILDELGEFRDAFRKNVNKANVKSKSELKALQTNLRSIKEGINKKLNEETDKSKYLLDSVTSEVQQYQSQMRNRIQELESKQQLHMDGLKMILENTSDNNTRQLAKKFLAGDAEDFEKIKDSYIKPGDDEINRMMKDMQSKQRYQNRKSQIMEVEVSKMISKNRALNQVLEEQTNMKENFAGKPNLEERSKLVRSISTIMYQHYEQGKDDYEMKPINNFRKYVHIVMACQRLKLSKKETSQSHLFDTLRQFTQSYSSVDEALKNFVFESVKTSFNSVVNFADVDLDISNTKLTSDSALKDRYIKLEVRLKGFFDNLILNTTKENLPPESIKFLKLLTVPSYIPFKFFTLFEMCRIQISKSPFPNCAITDLKEKHIAMIFSFYFVIKILVKHFILERNFNKLNKKTPPENVLKNFKIIASVMYNDCVDLYRKHCPYVNGVKEVTFLLNSQSLIKRDPKSYVDWTRLNKVKTDKSYIEAIKRVNSIQQEKSEGNSGVAKEEREIFEKFYSKLPQIKPETNPDVVEHIASTLYKPAELASYYAFAKENKFDLTVLIFQWVKKLIAIVKEE